MTIEAKTPAGRLEENGGTSRRGHDAAPALASGLTPPPAGLPNIVVRRAQVAIEWEQVEEGLVVAGDWIGVDIKPARGGFRLDEALHAGVEMGLERLAALRRGEG